MQQNKSSKDISNSDERLLALQDAHGPVLYNMTNDYLFGRFFKQITLS